jgi:hypothetical protein
MTAMRRVLLAVPGAWLVGLATYVGALWLFWGQAMGGGDATAVMFWSFVALLIAVPVVYWPAFSLLHKLRRGFRPAGLFALVAAALGIVPTAMITWYWGGDLASLLSPAGRLFYGLFATAGIVLGLAYALRRESTAA